MTDHAAFARRHSVPSIDPATLEDILITDRLHTRPRREKNLQDEGTSLRILARMLRSAPRELVDTLLHVTLSLCNADAAGLSVLETLPNGEEVFRWTNLAGTLQRFVGGSTLRHFSPCGVCLDRNAPQLFSYPERRFQYLAEAVDVPIVEALVVPIPFGDESPATIWIVTHKEGVEFDAEDARIMTDLADFTGCALHLVQRLRTEEIAVERAQSEVIARRRSEDELRLSHAELEATVKTRTSQLRQLTAKLLSLQDEERRRIARELHDSTGQYLAGIQMNLDAALRDPALSPSVSSRLTDSKDMVEQCLSEVRTISYLLHPPLLDEVGLRAALSWYIDGFSERSGIRVELNVSGELGRLPSEIETAIFRAVQQGLANIHRHSGSKVAQIMMELDAETLLLEIRDEGCGIGPESLKGFNEGTYIPGVGIAGIRERVMDMGGLFHIRTSDRGTTMAVSLPLPQDNG